jgi:nucleoside permease NupC
VAFVAFIALADALLTWLTTLAGFDEVNIQFLLGKIFTPISWLIGVDWKDCEAVGYIIGTKSIVNEFVAFKLLGEYKTAGTISVSINILKSSSFSSFYDFFRNVQQQSRHLPSRASQTQHQSAS